VERNQEVASLRSLVKGMRTGSRRAYWNAPDHRAFKTPKTLSLMAEFAAERPRRASSEAQTLATGAVERQKAKERQNLQCTDAEGAIKPGFLNPV
jgi:hypothetical protein